MTAAPQLRIGSLFSGTGALDLAVQEVFGGQIVWHSQYEPPDKKTGRIDLNQYAARILARHWPTVPNLGDITTICWACILAEYGPIDVLCGGFPCTDVSSAGQRAGLTPDTRSGLWNHFARAIAVLRPRLVVIENVEGLLSAPADRGLESGAEALDEEADTGRVLRAVGAVLGDLATLGFDAEWVRVAASDVGAAHGRKRVFILAWPASSDADCVESKRRGNVGVLGGQEAAQPGQGDQRERAGHAAGCSGEASADTADLGHQRCGGTRGRGDRPADSGIAAPDADRRGFPGHGEFPAGRKPVRERVRSDADRCNPPAADAQGAGQQGTGIRGRSAVAGGPSAPDSESVGRGEGRPESARVEGRSDAAVGGSASPADTSGDTGRVQHGDGGVAPDADHLGRRADVLNLRPGEPDVDWGDYGAAVHRHERVFGRSAPWPTDAMGRLSPVFTEWLMGLADGWVTCTPGLNRSAMLRALGNGVVPLQAVVALRHLVGRVGWEVAA